LDELQTSAAITSWHMDASALLEELEELGPSDEVQKAFEEEMRKGGWSPDLRRQGWLWGRTDNGYYIAPGGYRVLLARLRTSIHGRIQELMLGELAGSGDEAIPPQYQEFVDRYYQVLASEDGTPQPAAPVGP
jgi:hypothetical protein